MWVLLGMGSVLRNLGSDLQDLSMVSVGRHRAHPVLCVFFSMSRLRAPANQILWQRRPLLHEDLLKMASVLIAVQGGR